MRQPSRLASGHPADLPARAPRPGVQLSFQDVDGHRFQCFITDQQDEDIAALEVLHRQHAAVEDRVKTLKATGAERPPFFSFDANAAWLQIASDRHADQARQLLADTKAIVTSDRWWAYAHLRLARRQLCWSHLQRDFQAHAEGLAAEKEFGEVGLELSGRVSWAFEVFQHTSDRSELKRTIRSLQRTYKPNIRRHATKRAYNRRCRAMARNLLKAWPALWTFAKHPGIEPTNNHAERALRGAVIHRKLSLGSQSEGGEQRTARLLSAHTTCAYSPARCSSTSPTPSPPTHGVIPFRCSPEPGG